MNTHVYSHLQSVSLRLELWVAIRQLFFLFIEFIGVTLVNTIIQVSAAQFYSTSSVHCTVCSSPPVKSPSITIYPPSPLPLAIITLLSMSMSFFSFFSFLFNPSSPPNSPSLPPPTAVSLLSVLSLSLFCLLVHFKKWAKT